MERKHAKWPWTVFLFLIFLSFWHSNGECAITNSTGTVNGRKSTAKINDNTVVALVNREKISVGQLRQAMRDLTWKHNRALLGEENAKRMVLRNLVVDRLVLQSMKSAGKLRAPEYRDRMEGVKTLGLGNIYVQTRRRDFVPQDNDVRRYLPRYWKNVDIRVFFGATREDAEKAAREVQEGEDFAKIVKERSVGPGADRGGEIKNLRFGATFIPEHLDHLAFTREQGWISPLFENELGYCFFRIEKTEDISPESIKKQADSARAAAVEDAITHLIDEEYMEHHVILENNLLASLDTRPLSEWKKDFDLELAEIDGEKITVREFYWYLATGLGNRSPDNIKGRLAELFPSYVRYRGFAQKATREGMDALPLVKKGMDSYSEKVLLGIFMDEVKRTVKVTGKDAREFFRKKKDAFKMPEGRELRMIVLREERIAKETADQLRENPGRFPEFVKERSVDAATRRNQGKMGVVQKGRITPSMETAIFSAREGDVIGPISYEDLYYIFVVDKKIPALENPRYSDFSRQARDLAFEEKLQELLRSKRNALYEKAAVEMYPKILEHVGWPETSEEIGNAPHGMGH